MIRSRAEGCQPSSGAEGIRVGDDDLTFRLMTPKSALGASPARGQLHGLCLEGGGCGWVTAPQHAD